MLKKRFGNPQQIISVHMEGLLEISNCVNDHPGPVYNSMMVHIRGLGILEFTSELYGNLLIPIILTKFPSDSRLRIAKETGKEAWKIAQYLK